MNSICKFFSHKFESICAKSYTLGKLRTEVYIVQCKRCGKINWDLTDKDLETDLMQSIEQEINLGEQSIKNELDQALESREISLGATLTHEMGAYYRTLKIQVGILKKVLNDWKNK